MSIAFIVDGKLILVDAEDWEFVNDHIWHFTNEHKLYTYIHGKRVTLHRMLVPLLPKQYAKFKNGNPLDYRKCNLYA